MTMGFKHTYAYFEAEISEILSLLSRNQIYLMLIKKECTKLLKRTEPFQITTVHHIELKFEPFPGFSLFKHLFEVLQELLITMVFLQSLSIN